MAISLIFLSKLFLSTIKGEIPTERKECEGTWVAQLVKYSTSAQVMISRFVGSSPALGCVLAAQSLEPASDSLSLSLSLSLSKINIKKRMYHYSNVGRPENFLNDVYEEKPMLSK